MKKKFYITQRVNTSPILYIHTYIHKVSLDYLKESIKDLEDLFLHQHRVAGGV